MDSMEQLHSIQLRILFDLLFVKSLNFAELKPIYMENSQFVFHMKKLISKGLVEKHGSTYKLTEMGKEVANKIDVGSLEISMPAKSTAVFCAVRNGEYLIYKRLKNPFYGCSGFPTRKVLWGETAYDSAIKGLKEETGLDVSTVPELFAIRHYKVYVDQDELVEDKFMYCFLVENPVGDLDFGKEGDFFWVSKNEIKSTVKKPQEEFFDILEALDSYNNKITFKEVDVITKNF